MLPERLSNDLCSLRPHEDKLTFSAIFRMDEKAKVKERWFGRTVIHSDRRFTYEEAQEILDQGEGDFDGELRELNKLAHLLRKARFKNGSIDFDLEEVQFRLDEEGVPVEVFVKERKEAHMLIEDFMLLANREVAAYIGQRENEAEIPFVYRVHDLPNQDKVAELARFAWELGFRMNIQTPQQIAASFNALAKAAEENERLHILEPIAVRTMAKAEYSTENIGHYGLAFDYYSHFTSPIRRYSDVLAHRILFENLEDRRLRVDKSQLALQCKHISAQERRAMEAERESIKYKQVEFIKKHLGEQFEGFISGIIDRGFFVELKANKCEGFVPFDSMNDRFEVEEGRLEFTGRRTGLNLKMGDPVQVRIVSADLARRQIEMVLVDGEE